MAASKEKTSKSAKKKVAAKKPLTEGKMVAKKTGEIRGLKKKLAKERRLRAMAEDLLIQKKKECNASGRIIHTRNQDIDKAERRLTEAQAEIEDLKTDNARLKAGKNAISVILRDSILDLAQQNIVVVVDPDSKTMTIQDRRG